MKCYVYTCKFDIKGITTYTRNTRNMRKCLSRVCQSLAQVAYERLAEAYGVEVTLLFCKLHSAGTQFIELHGIPSLVHD